MALVGPCRSLRVASYLRLVAVGPSSSTSGIFGGVCVLYSLLLFVCASPLPDL